LKREKVGDDPLETLLDFLIACLSRVCKGVSWLGSSGSNASENLLHLHRVDFAKVLGLKVVPESDFALLFARQVAQTAWVVGCRAGIKPELGDDVGRWLLLSALGSAASAFAIETRSASHSSSAPRPPPRRLRGSSWL